MSPDEIFRRDMDEAIEAGEACRTVVVRGRRKIKLCKVQLKICRSQVVVMHALVD